MQYVAENKIMLPQLPDKDKIEMGKRIRLRPDLLVFMVAGICCWKNTSRQQICQDRVLVRVHSIGFEIKEKIKFTLVQMTSNGMY